MQHGRLDPAEGEVGLAVLDPGHRELHRPVVGPLGQAVDDRPPGIAQAEQLRHLVERFARGVVAGAAEQVELALRGHLEEARVAAGDDEGERGQPHRARMGEERGLEVARDVVHGNERLAMDVGEALGRLHAHEQRADEPRPLRHRHCVEGRVLHRRLGHRARDDGADVLDVVAGGELGHHAPEGRVDGGLAGDDAGQDAGPVLHHRRRRLVAGRLDTEDAHG